MARQPITCVNLTLTGHCSMRCPDCCCDIPRNKDKRHVTWDYLVAAAVHLQGLDRIHVTGGEPSLHPQFLEFAPKLRGLFNCARLTVESNGFAFKRHPEVFAHFDEVYCSRYSAATFIPGGSDYWRPELDNADKIAHLQSYYAGRPGPKIIVGEVVHQPRSTRGTRMCDRGTSETIAYEGGRLFPCCVGPGLDVKRGIPLTADWRTEILDVIAPCDSCFFALP